MSAIILAPAPESEYGECRFKSKKKTAAKIVVIRITGKLGKSGLRKSLPWSFAASSQQNGKLRVLLDMNDFLTAGMSRGLWEEVKFDLKHRADLERLSYGGRKEMGARYSRPMQTSFTTYAHPLL